jgi:hypothetical protein
VGLTVAPIVVAPLVVAILPGCSRPGLRWPRLGYRDRDGAGGVGWHQRRRPATWGDMKDLDSTGEMA